MTGRYKVKWIPYLKDTSVQDALNAESGLEFSQFIELSTGGALLIFRETFLKPQTRASESELLNEYNRGFEIGYDKGKKDGESGRKFKR